MYGAANLKLLNDHLLCHLYLNFQDFTAMVKSKLHVISAGFVREVSVEGLTPRRKMSVGNQTLCKLNTTITRYLSIDLGEYFYKRCALAHR